MFWFGATLIFVHFKKGIRICIMSISWAHRHIDIVHIQYWLCHNDVILSKSSQRNCSVNNPTNVCASLCVRACMYVRACVYDCVCARHLKRVPFSFRLRLKATLTSHKGGGDVWNQLLHTHTQHVCVCVCVSVCVVSRPLKKQAIRILPPRSEAAPITRPPAGGLLPLTGDTHRRGGLLLTGDFISAACNSGRGAPRLPPSPGHACAGSL